MLGEQHLAASKEGVGSCFPSLKQRPPRLVASPTQLAYLEGSEAAVDAVRSLADYLVYFIDESTLGNFDNSIFTGYVKPSVGAQGCSASWGRVGCRVVG